MAWKAVCVSKERAGKSMCAQQTETGQMAPPSSHRPPTHGYCYYRHPITQSCHHQRMNGAGPHCLRKNANLSSMERSKPSSPVSLAGGDAALSKYFHHLLLLPTRSPGLAHLSEALCLPHSKVQEHEVPRCPGCYTTWSTGSCVWLPTCPQILAP